MKKILVTGGGGFIGVQLIRKLVSEKVDKVIVIDNKSNAHKKFDKYISSDNIFTFYKEDIRNFRAIFEIINDEKIDSCIHLAAVVSVLDSVMHPDYTIGVNINGTFNVLEACSRCQVRNFIFASSCSVYGESKKLPLSEDYALNPLSPYAASKVAGEALVSSYMRTNKIQKAISLRFFNVYGENQNPQYAGVISKFAERLSSGLPPIIYGNGNSTRDFVYVDDVAQAIVSATKVQLRENIPISSYAFNVGTGVPTSISELAKKMIKIFKLELQPIHRSANSGEMLYCYADIKRSAKYLNFIAKEKFEPKLAQILEGFGKNKN